MAKKRDFLIAKEKQSLRRAANAMEQAITSVRSRKAAPAEGVAGINPQAAQPDAAQVLWHHMQEATRLLMQCGLILGTIEGADKRAVDDERAAQRERGIKVVSR